MKTPVLIPAHNEAEYIGLTLDSLSSASVEPIVIANACTDDTVKIVKENYQGVRLIELDQPGKLPALQYAIESLGDRALDPLLLLDADSRPVLPKRWEKAMVGRLDPDSPSVVSGPILYEVKDEDEDLSMFDSVTRSAIRYAQACSARAHGTSIAFGANMAIHLATQQAKGAVLELPFFWAHDDAAIRDTIVGQGRPTEYQQLSVGSSVVTSSRWLPPMMDRLRLGKATATTLMLERYAARAPEGSMPYVAGQEYPELVGDSR
jgi:glycosyltransferase involved in cell wall biosynthesis